jgi:hypothetical protein
MIETAKQNDTPFGIRKFELVLSEIEILLQDDEDYDENLLLEVRAHAGKLGIWEQDLINRICWLQCLWVDRKFEEALKVVDAMYPAN